MQIAALASAIADRYRIERELGAGGMATVYLAHDLRHDRQVAIKVLREDLAATLGADRFMAEIRTTANLHHPHIVSLLDSCQDASCLYYVMPRVEGESLRQRLRREGALPVEESVRLAREVLDALAFAHGRGIIHRDIKPENILLQAGHALVADFGIARALVTAGGPALTQMGFAVGTPGYMSPEQAWGGGEVDARTDVYAVGCVLYEMLTGTAPFAAGSPQASMSRQLVESVPQVRAQNPAVPAWLDAVVARALTREPEARWPSSTDFIRSLDGGGAPADRAIVTGSPERPVG